MEWTSYHHSALWSGNSNGSCLVFEDNCRLDPVIWSEPTNTTCDEDGSDTIITGLSDSEPINRNCGVWDAWLLSQPSGSAATVMSVIMSSSLWGKKKKKRVIQSQRLWRRSSLTATHISLSIKWSQNGCYQLKFSQFGQLATSSLSNKPIKMVTRP